MPARPVQPPTALRPPTRPGRRGPGNRVRTALADLAAPVALYYGLRLIGVDDLAALAAGTAASGLGVAATAVRRRHIDGLGALVLTTMLIGLVGLLARGNPRELLIRNAYLTAPAGVWTLATLRARRPICFLVTKAVLPRRAEVMDRLWDDDPRFRRAWRLITAMWGGIALADAALRVFVAYALPVDAVPAVDTTVTVATVVLLQLPTHLVLHRAGAWHQMFGRGRSARRPRPAHRRGGREHRLLVHAATGHVRWIVDGAARRLDAARRRSARAAWLPGHRGRGGKG